jgi:hypothetical protein
VSKQYPGTKFDLETGAVEFSTRVYPSREVYEAFVATSKAWSEFRQEVNRMYRPPLHLTADQIAHLTATITGDASNA